MGIVYFSQKDYGIYYKKTYGGECANHGFYCTMLCRHRLWAFDPVAFMGRMYGGRGCDAKPSVFYGPINLWMGYTVAISDCSHLPSDAVAKTPGKYVRCPVLSGLSRRRMAGPGGT